VSLLSVRGRSLDLHFIGTVDTVFHDPWRTLRNTHGPTGTIKRSLFARLDVTDCNGSSATCYQVGSRIRHCRAATCFSTMYKYGQTNGDHSTHAARFIRTSFVQRTSHFPGIRNNTISQWQYTYELHRCRAMRFYCYLTAERKPYNVRSSTSSSYPWRVVRCGYQPLVHDPTLYKTFPFCGSDTVYSV
jgi:hypothetical protein